MRTLEGLAEIRDSRIVLAYAPLPEEVDLWPLWRRFVAAGKTVAFPQLVGEEGRMDAVPASDFSRDLRRGRFAILQPVGDVPVDPREIDVVMVPAIAFDRRGHRLGRGGGYYDRFLAGRAPQAFRCGVGYECQFVDALPVYEHDCPMSAIVTETGAYRLNGALNSLSDRL